MAMAGRKIFSKIDCQKAFWQIPMKKEDIKKTPIITPITCGYRGNLTEQRMMNFKIIQVNSTELSVPAILLDENSDGAVSFNEPRPRPDFTSPCHRYDVLGEGSKKKVVH
ncbi:hypothetical protein Ciccas_008109, partial [Cichlidogyrus casuarinus]